MGKKTLSTPLAAKHRTPFRLMLIDMRLKILLVSPDAEMHERTKSFFSRDGWKVLVARTGL